MAFYCHTNIVVLMGKKKLGETIELSLGEKTIPVTISGFYNLQKLFLPVDMVQSEWTDQ